MAEKIFKILMVEDEPDIVEIYGSQLKNAGYSLETAANGKEALVWLEKNTPDLVLLDLLMPDMDGFEFLDKVKKYPNRKNIRIFAWSNLTQKKDVDLAKQKGVEDFLIKSDYTPKKLTEKITEIFKK